tara:strand:- start:1918 stop:2103 length:186 start_codon:yes stop_codon:yes gene_type:complete
MIDYFTNEDDVTINFPGFSFPISLNCFERMLEYYINRDLDKEEGENYYANRIHTKEISSRQ